MSLPVLTRAAERPHEVLSVVLHLKLFEFVILLLSAATVIHLHLCLCELVYMLSTELLDIKELPSVFEYLHYFRACSLLVRILALTVASRLEVVACR